LSLTCSDRLKRDWMPCLNQGFSNVESSEGKFCNGMQ
jgi:hypothetical protein